MVTKKRARAPHVHKQRLLCCGERALRWQESASDLYLKCNVSHGRRHLSKLSNLLTYSTRLYISDRVYGRGSSFLTGPTFFLLAFPRFGQQEKSTQGRIQKIHRVEAEEVVRAGHPFRHHPPPAK